MLVPTVSLRCDDRGDIVGAGTVKVEMQMANRHLGLGAVRL